MKTIVRLAIVIAMVFSPIGSLSLWAYIGHYGGLTYNMDQTTKKAVVTCETTDENNYATLKGKVIIPHTFNYYGNIYTVTEIGWGAFANSPLEEIEIPGTIERIGENAFKSCKSLKSLSILHGENPLRLHIVVMSDVEGVELYINRTLRNDYDFGYIFNPMPIDNPFQGSFKTIRIGPDVKKVLERELVLNPDRIGSLIIEDSSEPLEFKNITPHNTSFGFGVPVDSLYIGRNIDETGWPDKFRLALDYNPKVLSVGPKVTDFMVSFEGIESLTKVYFNPGPDLRCTEWTSFWDTPNLKDVEILNMENWTKAFFAGTAGYITGYGANPIFSAKTFSVNGQPVRNLVLPEGVTIISSGAFSNAENIESVTMPSTIREIEAEAFQGASNIKNVEIGDLKNWCSVKCDEPISSTVGTLTLNGEAIENLNIPDGVTAIGNNTFACCSTLKSVIIPEGVETIGKGAFRDCRNLESVKLPESLKTIEDNAFDGCSNLKAISLHRNISRIGDSAFAGCLRLESVDIDDIDAWCGIEFGSSKGSNPISLTKKFTVRGEEVGTLFISKDVPRVSQNAFAGAHNLGRVFVGAATIEPMAFANCTNLHLIATYSTEIGDKAFGNSPIEEAYALRPEPAAFTENGAPFRSSYLTMRSSRLYVPAESLTLYTTSGWSVFPNIAASDFSELDEVFGRDVIAAAPDVTPDSQPHIYVVDGQIYVNGLADSSAIRIYDSTGRIVSESTSHVSDRLQPGIYFVAVRGYAPQKVAVR